MTEAAAAGPPSLPQSTDRVAICIATFRRPVMLGHLLDSLDQLEVRDGRDVFVVVVDNDEGGSAAPVIGAHSNSRLSIHALAEPERNISLARNRGIAFAIDHGASAVALIDDDEVARPDWLEGLLAALERYDADAVCGPVEPIFEKSNWVTRREFFSPHDLRTGTPIRFGITNNALIRSEWLGDQPFDPEFGVTGGGDAHFFMRIVRDGARVVWTGDAVVEETIPSTRSRASWVLRRAFRIGHAYVRCRRSLLPAWRWLPATVLGAAARLIVGPLQAAIGIAEGRAGVLRGLRTLMHGLGTFSALAGASYAEYRRTHGA